MPDVLLQVLWRRRFSLLWWSLGVLGMDALLDFNMETIDPTTGCAHVAYADDNAVNMLRVANQTSGCFKAH